MGEFIGSISTICLHKYAKEAYFAFFLRHPP